MEKMTSLSIQRKKGQEPIVALTCYDFTSARLVDEAVDVVLVGDSLGMVIQGHTSTLPVTLEDVIYHTKAVARGVTHAHLVSDMPFMIYQISSESALRHAGRLLAEGGAEAVKLEGGVGIAKTVEKLTSVGIPVMGHIGLTPQSVHAFGGYKVQGKTDRQRTSILEDALALEDSGAYALVLEGMPSDLSQMITERLKIPTIGIGAGTFCDGQILVFQDLLGMNDEFKPKFVKRYANLAQVIRTSVQTFAFEVRSKAFPTQEHSFTATDKICGPSTPLDRARSLVAEPPTP